MPRTPDPGHDPLGRLDERLEAFDASRRKPANGRGFEAAGASDAYRLIAQMVGGVFGGLGLGWLVDHFAHTRPFGLVGGLLIGATMSIVATVRTVSRMSARTPTVSRSSPPAADADADADDD
jgi:ATP synthase protein I